MLVLALALAGAIRADTLPARADAARDAPPPEVAVHRQPALPVVALRLSLLADDPPGYAGAGHLFQHLLLPSLQEQVRRVGGRVSIARSADALVYTVTGPAAELDYLAGVLRSALRAPVAGTGEMLQALYLVGEERSAEREIAPQFMRAALRSRLFPDQISAAGTDAGARRLEVAKLDAVWAAMYRPDRVSVLAVGDVQADAVRRAFATLPDAEAQPAEALEDSLPAYGGVPPEATRGWVGAAWPADSAAPAALSVAARLLGDDLRRRLPGAQVSAEHWWTHEGQALAVVMAAPARQLPAARAAAGDALDSLAAGLDSAAVVKAAAGLRRDMLFSSRTPEKMAELLGGFADRAGDRGAADAFYAELDRVDAPQVRAVLELLARAAPVRVDVPPQRLRPSP
ncbi:MAG: Insulinase [Gemmatimonadetes bacterium]|nr:Insulinase [Gemmatimonadota bacterium]